ncbi:MAG: hypothetical protein LBB24_03810 [Rickettsiales bacterium]|nr:hypothetical protein [Rickettsiales bacterium]
MKIGFARLYAKNARPEYNFQRIEDLYGKALENDLEIVVFPRLSLSGFSENDDFADENYLERLVEFLEKAVSITDGKKTKMLIGSPLRETSYGEDGETIRTELKDAVLFIDDGRVDTEIFRKEIDRTNVLEDYRYFDRHRFLKCFTYRNKKFLLLLSDDIYSNFNLFLVKDDRPNYVLCLDSDALRPIEVRQKHLVKLAKFANSPVFYLNSASYHQGMLFRGELVLINEDFKVLFEDIYGGDEIFSFEIDCEDGTELLIGNVDKNTNPFHIMEKYFDSARITIDVDKFSDSELQRMAENDCEMVTFRGGTRYNARFIEVTDYISAELLNRLTAREQCSIRDRIVDIYHDRGSD